MPRNGATFLLDENIPYGVTAWLTTRLPGETTVHIRDLGLAGAKDGEVMAEAVRLGGAIVITYDEDLADPRQFPIGTHGGVIRLRVDPTTEAKTAQALDRLFDQMSVDEIARRLVIVTERQIRVSGAAVPTRSE